MTGQSSGQTPVTLSQLLEEVELRLACPKCSNKQNQDTYTVHPGCNNCTGCQLLARPQKGKDEVWRLVRQRPRFPVPARYAVCWYYQPGKRCTKHQQCTFAWSEEERLVWAFEKSRDLQRSQLRDMLWPKKSTGATPKAPTSWEEILREFGGHFQEVCEPCFFQSPPKVTLCIKCHTHPRPVPLLVHVESDELRKQCHPIRQKPFVQQLRLCRQPSRGLLCPMEGGHCPYAHSLVELAVWKAEQEFGLSRGQIVRQSELDVGFYCRLCLISSSTQEGFEAHCSSLEHRRMMAADSLTVWNHRAPPIILKDLTLCESPQPCVYGNVCPKAHSREELEEWIMRMKVGKRNRQVAEAEGLQPYQDRLIQEYQLYSADMLVLSEEVEGVTITSDLPLRVLEEKKPARRTWTFTVHTKMPLLHVALLKLDPGACFTLLAPDLRNPCTYAGGSSFRVKSSKTQSFEVRVLAECETFGLFEQWLVLDFGARPVLVQKIFLQVGGQNDPLLPAPNTSNPEGAERWHPGTKLFIPCKERTQEEKTLSELYKQPAANVSHRHESTDRQPLTAHNYRKRMHEWLLQEEAAREQVLSRLNMRVSATLSKTMDTAMGMKICPDGELFAEVPLPSGITQDTEEGYLLHRSVDTALLALSPAPDDKVYEVHVDRSAGLEGRVLLQIPERCCRELALEKDTAPRMEVQFQLDRSEFCINHGAVDRLLDVSLLFPDFSKCCPPTTKEKLSWGNAKQQLAASYIMGSVPEGKSVAPLLIYGPFGTGKTFTMARAALELVKKPGPRVLICTHNNSAADLYIAKHVHPHVQSGHPEAAALRVKYTQSPINRTDAITLQYCPVKDSAFYIPDLSELERHRIVVTTAVTSRDLAVWRGYFSHIFLDETAQMLESEALIPLAFADRTTRIIIAGDHMQETPRQYSWGKANFHEEHTLLTRLFSHYQRAQSPVARAARVILHQNYRSVPAIISFVSRCFYVGQDDAIEACGTDAMAPPAGRHALGLCHVRGPCTRDGSSWVNQAEVLQVLEVVTDVLNRWPESWGAARKNSVCVLSQGSQVRLIRQELRKIKLSDVTVTDYTNIIGREFRVIILSTVRSVDSLPAASAVSSNFTLDVFCDPRVLNTVLTRAQSQIIVVGDMVALCSFGYCSRIWRRYVRECVEKGSSSPPDLSVEAIKEVASSLQAWRGLPEEEEEAEDGDSWISDPDVNLEDSILQELLNSKTEAIVTVTEEGMMEVRSGDTSAKVQPHKRDTYTDFPLPTLKRLLQSYPNDYKRCLLVKKYFDSGYALTLDDRLPCRIPIEGRMNCGLGFSGDEVLVQLLQDSSPRTGKVVGVMKAGEDCRRFVCFMDPYDTSIMVPTDRSITKIFCPMFRERPDLVPIRSFSKGQLKTVKSEKLTQEIRRKRLFLVQVVRWTKEFFYPMGIVNCILPVISTTEEGLRVLDLQLRLDSPEKYPQKATNEAKKLLSRTPPDEGRQDCRNLITFTIDPASAKDLDDAISIRELGDHYEIGVHISDLSTLVSPGSELDKEAKARGVTFYPPEADAIHMFPAILSCDLFSLKPQCDRPAMSLFVKVEKSTDRMVDYHFCRTLIRSDRQLSYEEASSILSARRRKPLSFDSLEDCVRTAWHFSLVHCRSRLQEASAYKQPDEGSPLGSRNATRMIEELMIMYNGLVADFLCEQKALRRVVPLKCQAQPDIQKTEELRKKLNPLIPLSAYLSHHLLEAPEPQKPLPGLQVTMLSSVWKRIQDAAREEDYSTAADLLCTDDLHPELCYATVTFRRHLGGASLQRAGTSGATGHYSLNLPSYTWASSPIRRYLDIVVQRLLGDTLAGTRAQVSAQDMESLCHNFDKRVRQETSYKKQGLALQLALSFRTEVQQKLAVVVSAEPNDNSFKVVFPLNGDSLSDLTSIDYNLLQPSQQPQSIVGGTCLSWRRRVYSYNGFKELSVTNISLGDITVFRAAAWRDAIAAVDRGDPEKALSILKGGRKIRASTSLAKQSRCGHYVDTTLELRPGVALFVQLCPTLNRGLPTPSPQLCSLCPHIQLCLEHTLQPVDCFSQLAHRPPLNHYKSLNEYQQVWQPLCALEAVASAISEGGGVLLRDVPVKWNRAGTNVDAVGLQGSFKISTSLIKECDLDLDFHHCYLCVRLERLPATTSATLLDPRTFTWVVHGLTDPKSEKQEEGWNVKFRIHQSTMCHVPEAAFQSTARFTLEIIPKLLPDIRKEMAVKQLKTASELAKSIALGKKLPDLELNSKFRSQPSFNITKFPKGLNRSQTLAVRRALTKPFTLIQGPPGTGKTLVGAHLVFWFDQINKMEAKTEEPAEEEPGRRVLMYCGPSNKSVDVVAGMLLRTQMRPLRVYSEQMELSEFPYPDSKQRQPGDLREGRPDPTLRSITLHHRIRQPMNPFHQRILEMDRRIRNGEQIPQEEVTEYKKILDKARKKELASHDIILCTCLTSSSSMLAKLPVSQIVVDECAMCTEPEVLVPLVSHKRVESVVLIGDHMQLRPVIQNDLCLSLNMGRSLFERYQSQAVLLDTQYRMHKEICAFPSKEFYEGRLATSHGLHLKPSMFCHRLKPSCPVVFGQVNGEEHRLTTTGKEGNFNSKANREEAKEAVRLVKCLVQKSVEPKDVAILTPYNAQVSEITQMLQGSGLSAVTVCTIMKSQGSEWRYVILSTVRTVARKDLENHPTLSWTRQHLGFLADPNQINVALTRSKEGLCVLGNSLLLQCCPLWRRLLKHYRKQNAVMSSLEIKVGRTQTAAHSSTIAPRRGFAPHPLARR